MFPKSRSRQQGFLIPLALFILVGMLALALTASRLTGQSSTSTTLELLSTQAFYAAESGGQYAMYQLSLGSGCVNEVLNFSVTGLQACQANVICTLTSGTDYYVIRSEGSCGAGDMSAQRTIQITASM